MPTSSSPAARPKTLAQITAIWMRKATSPNGRAEFLQALADGTIDPGMRSNDRENLLHRLAEASDTTVFDAVFERLKRDPAALARAMSQATDRDGHTPLMVASAHGNLTMVKALLNEGADPNRCSRHDGPALHLAAAGWHLEVVEALLASGARVNDGVDQSPENARSVTALSKAIYDRPKTAEGLGRQLAVVNHLLAAGADPNRPDDGFAMTNLCRAMTNASEAVVRRLIDVGASLDAPGISGHTALIDACSRRRRQGDTDAWAHTRESIRALLAAGANVNHANNEGCTALWLAARSHDAGLIADLLDAGARVEATAYEGRTALMSACAELALYVSSEDLRKESTTWPHTRHVIRTLMNAGSDLTQVDDKGNTALHLAVPCNDHTLISDLLSAGADPLARNHAQKTAMALAMDGHNGKPFEQSVLALELWDHAPDVPTPRDRARL